MFAKCIAALEVAHDDNQVQYPLSNHIYVKLIELTFDVGTLPALLVAAASSFEERLRTLGVQEVELSFHVQVPSGLIPMRVLVNSPIGYSLSVHMYYETIESRIICLHRAESAEDVVLSPRANSCEAVTELMNMSNSNNNINLVNMSLANSPMSPRGGGSVLFSINTMRTL